MTLEKKRLGIVEKKPKQKIEQEKTRSEKQILNTQLGTISSTFSLVEFPNSKKTPYLLRFQKTELPIPLSRGNIMQIARVTQLILDIYVKGGHMGEKIYSKLGTTCEIDGNGKPELDIFVNNRLILPDTKFLSHDYFLKCLGENEKSLRNDPNAPNNLITQYSKWLNDIIQKNTNTLISKK